MFSFYSNSLDSFSTNGGEKDDQTISLEAFQGDYALIQTVNKLNELKQHNVQDAII